MMTALPRGPWKLQDLQSVPKNGKTVFSCFHCGGGSTMGYKLAGFDVIGGVEIDPEMMDYYRKNHNPRFSYLMGIQEFNKKPKSELPAELLNLDILDGSPPCSTFSTAGSREEAWGKKKKFREGQTAQILDDLFFHFIETARLLQPKVVIAENVKGLIQAKARGFVKQIIQGFSDAGYNTQLFLLNSAFMGVPQTRERTFFIASKKSLELPKLKLEFNERPITAREAFEGITEKGKDQSHSINYKYWLKASPGENLSAHHPKGHLFTWVKLNPNAVAKTVVANSHTAMHWETMRQLCKRELFRLQTFPDDYFAETDRKAGYICGMSVPPFMMNRIADQVYKQWLK